MFKIKYNNIDYFNNCRLIKLVQYFFSNFFLILFSLIEFYKVTLIDTILIIFFDI